MEHQDSLSFSGVFRHVPFVPDGLAWDSRRGSNHSSWPGQIEEGRMIHPLAMSSGGCKVGKGWVEAAFELRCVSHLDRIDVVKPFTLKHL